MSIAKAVVTGKVFRSPQTGTSSNGVRVSSFVLNIGDKEEMLMRVLVKRNALIDMLDTVTKGAKVLVEGRLQTSTVKDDGKERKIYEIDAAAIELMGAASSSSEDFSNETLVNFGEEELTDELIGEEEIPF